MEYSGEVKVKVRPGVKVMILETDEKRAEFFVVQLISWGWNDNNIISAVIVPSETEGAEPLIDLFEPEVAVLLINGFKIPRKIITLFLEAVKEQTAESQKKPVIYGIVATPEETDRPLVSLSSEITLDKMLCMLKRV